MEEYNNFFHKLEVIEECETGKKFKIFVRIPFSIGWVEKLNFTVSNFNIKKVFQIWHVGNDNEYSCFEAEVFLENSAIYHYWFSFEASGRFMYYKKINITGDNSIVLKEAWKLSVGFEVPDWAKGAIMYHIFVDRYRKGKDTNLELLPNRTIHENWNESPFLGPDENQRWNIDFFGGNLKGIEETLNYIKSFGTSIIYLSPIVKSQSNHRYDTADYEEIDPYAGTDEILKELCQKAHKKNMYIVLDAVFNHTGNDSKYFNEYGNYDTIGAFQNDESPYSSFYRRTWNNGNHDFAYWWGMKNLPECDGYSNEWKQYILGEGGVIDKWFSLGIDGLRLDVADELTDEFIEGIRTAVHRNKEDGFVIGEVWKNPMRMNRGYISSGRGMDSVMNYLLVDALIRYYKFRDIDKLRNIIDEIQIEYPDGTINTLMNFTSTHDISRLVEICGCNCFEQYGEWSWNLLDDSYDWVRNHEITKEEYYYGKKILKSYISALAFMPGIFSIFYGDEVGLKGIGNLKNRSPYPWGRRDKDLLNFFRKICKIRKNNEFLSNAKLRILDVTDKVLIFERVNGENKILIATNRSHHPSNINLPEEYLEKEIIFNLPNCTKENLSPYGAIIIK